MTTVLSLGHGRVATIPEPGFPMLIKLTRWVGFEGMNALITSISAAPRGNYQFQHTLKNFIYVYVFGERISPLQIGGVIFVGEALETCAGQPHRSGFELVYDYYDLNRLSKTGEPVQLIIGGGVDGQPLVLEGFLTDGQLSISDPSTGIGQFTLQFQVFPRAEEPAPPLLTQDQAKTAVPDAKADTVKLNQKDVDLRAPPPVKIVFEEPPEVPPLEDEQEEEENPEGGIDGKAASRKPGALTYQPIEAPVPARLSYTKIE